MHAINSAHSPLRHPSPPVTRDDTTIAGDYPESDPEDEGDPLGFLSWPITGGAAGGSGSSSARGSTVSFLGAKGGR